MSPPVISRGPATRARWDEVGTKLGHGRVCVAGLTVRWSDRAMRPVRLRGPERPVSRGDLRRRGLNVKVEGASVCKPISSPPMPITFNGSPFNARDFSGTLMRKAVEAAQEAMLDRFHGLASSMIDPATGRHSLTFACKAEQGIKILTTGSQAFALLLERRLTGDESTESIRVTDKNPELVYLAHAWEDKAVARPIAEYLFSQGIETWFDQWEMRTGDSLRQKMDQGLGDCTHFVVLLTKASLERPWVKAEIDAGFGKRIDRTAGFMPLRYDLSVSALPPLMRFIVAPEIDPNIPSTMRALVSDILDVSLKPSLGQKPRYVQTADAHPHHSRGAVAVAEVIVRTSKAAGYLDPQLDLGKIAELTGMPEGDVEIGTYDLVKAGLLEQSKRFGSTRVWPLGPLFVSFDERVMGWSPARDAQSLAAAMVNGGNEQWSTDELQKMMNWPDRRMNAALHAIEASKLALTRKYLGTQLVIGGLMITVETKRAARDA